MTDGPRLDLLRPRDIGGLFGDAFTAYVRNFGAFVAIGAAVVVPVELVVSGVGLGELSGGYGGVTTGAAGAVIVVQSYLLIGPLVTAMVIHALLAVADGRRPNVRRAITSGLEAFRPIFVAVLIAAVGIALGFVLLILPGFWLLIRWFFAPQAVVVDGRQSVAALERSAELVRGSWWRVFGLVIFAVVATNIPATLIQLPFNAWASSADSSAIQLVGEIVASAITAPFEALILTLLYFDLLARRSLPAMVPPVQPPPA
ncbi:MAG TPA: hypothetical protein VJU60_13420 [Thermoleophilaceae bacterium]|nr:hypothetical protein [Thermoleophilaceae bacterium]